MTNRGTSYQLPDIPSLIRDFELDTNPHCRSVSDASETWFSRTHLEKLRMEREEYRHEVSRVRGIKAGLLAALCFPKCDAPQLRLMTDSLTAIAWIHLCLIKAKNMSECGWNGLEGSTDSADLAWKILSTNTFFAPLVPQLQRLSTRGHPQWPSKFTASALAFRQTHLRFTEQPASLPKDIDHLICLRTDASGLRMILDLSELVKELQVPQDSELLELHKQNTMNIIIWGLEMVSYGTYNLEHNKWNAVSYIMKDKEISLQGALKVCMSRVREHVEAFRTTERCILDSLYGEPEPPPPPRPLPTTRRGHHVSASSIWEWFSRVPTPSPPPPPTEIADKPRLPLLNAEEWDENVKEDVRSYTCGMRDCVVGYVNWMYETEVYFGKLGEEVRATGWTFLPPT